MAFKQSGWSPFTKDGVPRKKKVGPVANNTKTKKWTGSDKDYQKHWDEVDAHNRKLDIEGAIDDAHGKTTVQKGRRINLYRAKMIKPVKPRKRSRTKKMPKDIVRTNKP